MPRRRPLGWNWIIIPRSPCTTSSIREGSGSNWMNKMASARSKDARVPPPPGSRWFGRVRAHPRRHWRPVPSSVRGDDRVARLVPSGLQRPTQFQGLGELVDKSSRSLEARVVSAKASSSGSSNTNGNFPENFFNSKLPNKILQLLALIAISRAGVYIPLPGVDTKPSRRHSKAEVS